MSQKVTESWNNKRDLYRDQYLTAMAKGEQKPSKLIKMFWRHPELPEFWQNSGSIYDLLKVRIS
jgi:hypothetical protein